MSHYKSNLRDIEFNLFEVFGRGDVLGHGAFAEMDVDTARDMLERGRASSPPASSPSRSPTPTATRRSSTRRRTR